VATKAERLSSQYLPRLEDDGDARKRGKQADGDGRHGDDSRKATLPRGTAEIASPRRRSGGRALLVMVVLLLLAAAFAAGRYLKF
jgi:hypothetical protein